MFHSSLDRLYDKILSKREGGSFKMTTSINPNFDLYKTVLNGVIANPEYSNLSISEKFKTIEMMFRESIQLWNTWAAENLNNEGSE
jgi:hypothetical protein